MSIRPTDDEQEQMEAAKVKVRQGPKAPSERERQEHEEAGHVLFRSWCVHCASARGIGQQHHSSPEEDGEDLTEALAFVSSQGNILIQPVPPTRRYADLIVGGAELRGLPSDYIDWLRIEQAGSLETRRTATSPACKPDLWYYATRGAFVSWSLAAAASAVWVGAPLVELISRAQ